MPRTPTFADVIRDALEARVEQIRVAIPGEVQSYDSATQTAAIQPLIQNVFTDSDGNELVEIPPQLPDVPVIFPRAGGFFLTFPVQVGDTVLLIANDRSVDSWRENGNQSHPGDSRKHDLSDAVALVGFYPKGSALPSAEVSTDSVVLGAEGGVVVEVAEDTVYLGGTVASAPSNFVALANLVNTRVAAIETKLNVHIAAYNLHVHATAGTGTPSAPTVTDTAMTPGSSVSAAKVKAL